ncbi:MAG TPA: hypothetical protein VG435_14145 [Acidimicrobiales bacterium]|nr:hypothetical protein [Acidimicrobiales bacterium]
MQPGENGNKEVLKKEVVGTIAQRIAALKSGGGMQTQAQPPTPKPSSVFKPKPQVQPKPEVTPSPSVSKPTPSGSGSGKIDKEDEYLKAVRDSAESYAKGLDDEAQSKLTKLADEARRSQLKELIAERTKDLVPARPFWRDKALNAAVDHANRIITGALDESQKIVAIGKELPGSMFVDPAGDNLFRNASAFLSPQTLLDQGCLRGRMEPDDPVAGLKRIFADPKGAFAVVDGYVRKPSGSGGMTLSSGPEVAAMSATTARDNTLGNSPTWQYTFPRPELSKVEPDTIRADLGVTESQARNLEGTAYELKSDSGGIAGATILAFVSTASSKEHMFLTTLDIPGDLAFRAYTGIPQTTYRTKWKRLNADTLDLYTTATEKYDLPM